MYCYMRKCMIYNVYLIVLLSLFSCTSEIDKPDSSDRKINEKYRFIYDAVKEGPEFEYFKYEVTDWRSIVSKHPFDTPKIPALGWKVMGPFISLYHAYRLTNDSYFSELLGEMTEELVKSRDDIRNVISWNGKIYPLWASGRRSHNAYFEIKDIYGKVCAIVDFHGSGFDDTYVSLKPHGEEFDFLIENNNQKYELLNVSLTSFENALNDIDWTVYVSPLPGNKVLSVRILDENNIYLKDEKHTPLSSYYVPHLANNAIIINLLINYYNINPSANKKYEKIIAESVDELLALFLCDLSDNMCCFNSPLNSPCFYGGGSVLPFNEQFVFCETLARWYAATGNKMYLDILKKWRNYFMSCLIPLKDGYVWKYWEDPSGTVNWMETENYGAIDIPALMVIKYNTDVFSNDDIRLIISALSKYLIKNDSGNIFTATGFSFERYRDGLPNIAYLTLKEFWPGIKDVFAMEDILISHNWMECVDYMFFSENSLEKY